MSSQLDKLRQTAAIEAGAMLFFQAHKDVYSCDANLAILSDHIVNQKLSLDSLESWEAAFNAEKSKLASKPLPTPKQVSEEPAEWPYGFCRPVRNLADIASYPPAEYKALWNDKNHDGSPTEKSRIFHSLINAILEGRR